EVSTLFFGGISLASEPGGDAYAHLCARESVARTVMIDPNIRANFISDEARYRARLSAMLGRADIVKLSDEDLDWWLPDARPVNEKAQALCQNGAALVIITQGARGAQGFLPDGTAINVPSQRSKVVDTVGAGDTFNAGVLAGLAKGGWLDKGRIRTLTGDAVREALDLGARVAAITVSRAGANPPWAHELPDTGLAMA
ncbi:MAG TPA: carbohydrate kinase, partial [Aliiroseovarius sp.]|nr:carbohydrate kinase [Aliiroseovarius sp.]